jgi:hypothetical protein
MDKIVGLVVCFFMKNMTLAWTIRLHLYGLACSLDMLQK